ncbi:hypothetical protein CCACVL1_10259 [Corchorus capsularis]|uniref:Uncharacterized protein n=1 Tax=Corchorus capsularis TaxID=210143 RepID=A0A1R3IRZ0_COCAP|nr:hypothetical protein CCACVL1_10259 [Corchorus capsularis]
MAALSGSALCLDIELKLTGFLAAWPPSSPALHVKELLIAIADFDRDLEFWNIRAV